MTDSAHVSWNKIWTVLGVILIPIFSVLYFTVVAGTKLIDKVDVMSVKIDKTDERLDRMEIRQNATDAKVDTIAHRQEVNTLKQDFRYQIQQAKK